MSIDEMTEERQFTILFGATILAERRTAPPAPAASHVESEPSKVCETEKKSHE